MILATVPSLPSAPLVSLFMHEGCFPTTGHRPTAMDFPHVAPKEESCFPRKRYSSSSVPTCTA